jgi:hypothetical protein
MHYVAARLLPGGFLSKDRVVFFVMPFCLPESYKWRQNGGFKLNNRPPPVRVADILL